MIEIRRAEARDIGGVVAALVKAFDQDPLMRSFFDAGPGGFGAGAGAFFEILIEARIGLGMPALVLEQGKDIVGIVMGYDTTRPAWPAPLTERWQQLAESLPGFESRLAAYDRLCETHQPTDAHFYLGTIGVHPAIQGTGAGGALLDAFCALSRADPRSHGVYLDTSNAQSLRFYQKRGFEVRGEGALDGAHIWCVYRPNALGVP